MTEGEPSIFACGCNSKIAKSIDDGKTWDCYKTGALDDIISHARKLLPGEHVRLNNQEFVWCTQ